jgi:eukaryotic-like serine/threonine-protein kinase
MDPGALPPDAAAVVASVGFQPRRRLGVMGGLGRWRVVSGPNESSCTALLLPAGVVSEELDRRIEVLTTVRHAHLAATYRSLPTKGGSRVVLGAEVDGLGLDLLREVRPRWEPGEVVTLVAPLAGALACLHRHGLVHGALDVHAVTIAFDGRPMLEGLVRAQLPPVPPTPRADVRALARLGLSLVDDARSPLRDVLAAAASGEPVGEAEGDRAPADDASDLARACESAAVALPIRLPSAEVLAARVLSVRTEGAEPAPRGRGPVLARAGVDPAPGHRRSTVIRALAAIAGVAVAVLALGAPAVRGTFARTPGATDPTPATSATATSATATSAPADPVAAARDLTRRRDAAIEDLDEGALNEVTVEGSPAREQDLSFLNRLRDAGVRLDGLVTEVVEAAEVVEVGGPSPSEPGAVFARVLLTSRIGAHRELGPGGQVLRELPASATSRVVLDLTWARGSWRVSAVEPARP